MKFAKFCSFALIAVAISTGAVCAPEHRAAANSSDNKRVVLPLDHGPHAVSTPWLNQRRLLASSNASKEPLPSNNLPGSPSDQTERRP